MKKAPTAGKSRQSNYEPPHSKRNTHLSHCWNSGEREGKGKEANCLGDPLPHYKCVKLWSMSMWDFDTWTYVSTLLTTMGTQAFFVVNSIELHFIGKFITWRGNSTLNCTWKPISHESWSDECDIGFQVQFNAEFTSQVMNFPWIA